MQHVVIMAGGSGTRFWPKSRRAQPKQFLSIGHDRSLLRQTVDRVLPLVGTERLWVVTAAVHAEHARKDIPELPADQLLVEPEGRNTAPCIVWATKVIRKRDPEARIAVLPADHFIGDPARFQEYVGAAFEAAVDRIVLFGIVPSRPETGYGYIQQADLRGQVQGRPVYDVARFVEKPDRPTAEGYLAHGGYLWNSGMFVFQASVMEEEARGFLPELDAGLERIVHEPDLRAAEYATLPAVSIDYGVMEKSRRTAVMPAEFAWSDVGSWASARDVYPLDGARNVVLGDAFCSDVSGSLVDARAGRFVAVVGLEDVVVVDTPDALLVMRTDRAQDVKKVVEALKSGGRDELL